MLDPNGGPGLIITDGELTQLDMQLSGGFDIFGLKLSVTNAGVSYVAGDEDPAHRRHVQRGLRGLPDLADPGHRRPTPGWRSSTASSTSIRSTSGWRTPSWGRSTLNELQVSYQADGDSFDLGVTVTVTLRRRLDGGRRVRLRQGQARHHLDRRPAVPPGNSPIPDTGLSITDIHVKVTNLDNPVEHRRHRRHRGRLGRANPHARAGRSTCSGPRATSPSTPTSSSWTARPSSGPTPPTAATPGRASLGAGRRQADPRLAGQLLRPARRGRRAAGHLRHRGRPGVRGGQGHRAAGRGRAWSSPTEVPFIGGDKIGGLGFFFQHVFPHDNIPTSTTFAAWIDLDLIIWTSRSASRSSSTATAPSTSR